MKKLFRKAMTVLGSALMVGATIGMAAAASYPAPFVQSGSADVAIVYGSNAAVSDAAQAGILQGNLATALAAATATGGSSTDATVSGGDAVSLDTSATRIWLNTSLNTAKSIFTKSDLPNILGDETFSGNVDSAMTQTIKFVAGAAAGGDNSGKVIFAKQPSSNDDPVFGISLGTTQASALYNASVTFGTAVAFNNTDSEGETITLFGRDFVVSTATTATSLVLFSSAQESTLTLGGSSPTPSTVVTIDGTQYTVELVTGTSTTATIAVNGESKEVNEGSSKKIGGIDVAIKSVTESTAVNTVVATLLIGSNKLTFTDGSQVLIGSDDDPIDGTSVDLVGTVDALTGITVSVFRPDSSSDAIFPGQVFTDPVFGGFKVDFVGMSIGEDSTTRETIAVQNSGDDTMTVTLTDYAGNAGTVEFAHNQSGQFFLGDDTNYTVNVMEMANLSENEYIVLGNEEYGHILQVTDIYNTTTGSSSITNDRVKFKDVLSGDTYSTTFTTTEGSGTLTLDGKQYVVTFTGSDDEGWAQVKYPTSDSSATGYAVYPTIKTKNGALVALYQPLRIDMADPDKAGTQSSTITLNFPDGDGYTAFTATGTANATADNSTWTIDSTAICSGGGCATGAVYIDSSLTVGQLTYRMNTTTTANDTNLYLNNPETGAAITDPALIIFEGKDDANVYNALVVQLKNNPAGTSTNGVEVNDLLHTATTSYSASLASDSDITKEVDLWGTVSSIDANDDQTKLTMLYPASQIYAQIYLGENDATISGGTSTGGAVTELGNVIVSDSEVASVSNKNLVVVGGSCINTVAADLLGSTTPVCSEAFTTLTGVSAGGYLIQSFERTGGKVAVLVAGYNAADTVKAVTYLTNNAVMTEAGKKYTGTSATEASLVTTTA